MNFWEIAGMVLVGLAAFACILCLLAAFLASIGHGSQHDGLAVIGVRLADWLAAFFMQWVNARHANRRAIVQRDGGRMVIQGRLTMRPWWKD